MALTSTLWTAPTTGFTFTRLPVRPSRATGPWPAANGNPYGISSDGTNIYVVDLTDDRVYVYSAAGASISSNWALASRQRRPLRHQQ